MTGLFNWLGTFAFVCGNTGFVIIALTLIMGEPITWPTCRTIAGTLMLCAIVTTYVFLAFQGWKH
jgi:hypothetical protein